MEEKISRRPHHLDLMNRGTGERHRDSGRCGF